MLLSEDPGKLNRVARVFLTRFGVTDEIYTGDHSCIRLSGCPSLTVKPNPDPLRSDPVATVIESCVGCGLCGEVAQAAALCPSFYKAELVRNPTRWDRFIFRVRGAILGWFGVDLHAASRAPQPSLPSNSSLRDAPTGASPQSITTAVLPAHSRANAASARPNG